MKKLSMLFFACMLIFGSIQGAGISFAEPKRGRTVPTVDLPDDLKKLDIKDYFIPSKGRPAGYLRSLSGSVVVIHKDKTTAYFAAKRDKIFQGDTIYTLKDSRCRLRFESRDLVTMGEETKVSVDHIINEPKKRRKKSVFSMLKGKAMFYAIRLFKYRNAGMEVKTPTAVCGVRGTKFGVEISKSISRSASATPIYLASASAINPAYFYAADNPSNLQTLVHGFDGEVDVTALADGSKKTVGPGQSLEIGVTGPGDVHPTNPLTARRFAAETDAPEEDEDEGGEQQEEESKAADKQDDGDEEEEEEEEGEGEKEGEEEKKEDQGKEGEEEQGEGKEEKKPLDLFSSLLLQSPFDDKDFFTNDQATEATQNQTAQQKEQSAPAPPPRLGYFTGLISNQTNGSLFDAALSKSPQNFNVDPVRAFGLKYPLLAFLGKLDRAVRVEIGHNSSQQWGYWTTNDSVPYNGVNYGADNTGYYIFGDTSPDAAVAGFNGIGTYGGPAYGTWWTAGGGIKMRGGFYCRIDFNQNLITDFDVIVQDDNFTDDLYAVIENAVGTFSGSTGHFTVSGGTWKLINEGTHYSPDYMAAYGSLYGSGTDHPEAVGGVWSLLDGGNQIGAVGIFQGSSGILHTMPTPPPSRPVNHHGYFSAMVSQVSTGSWLFHSFVSYVSSDELYQDFDSDMVKAMCVCPSPQYYIKLTGGSPVYHSRYLGAALLYDMEQTYGTAHPVTFNEMGYNQYQEWGSWTTTGLFQDENSNNYEITYKGYYMVGDRTPLAAVENGISGSYAGNAWGTYYGGQDMTGTFSCDVNTGAQTISGFNMAVTGGQGTSLRSVTATNLSGTFNGASFMINDGTWTMTSGNASLTPTKKRLSGSLYGSDGRYIGGTWGVYKDSDNGAVGLFQGGK